LPTATGETTIPLTTLPGRLADEPRSINLDRLPNPIYDLPASPSAQADLPQLVLRGYKVNERRLYPGDTLSLTLHWQVLEQPQHNYQLEFFLLNEEDYPARVLTYRWPAAEPVGGEWSTSQWPADYWVQDKLDLPISADIPAGQFKLSIIWVEAGTEQSALDEEVNLMGFELGSVIIDSER
jgi:hypothetical protein